jgi:hypothetical protein
MYFGDLCRYLIVVLSTGIFGGGAMYFRILYEFGLCYLFGGGLWCYGDWN